jgi:hypothetical protein
LQNYRIALPVIPAKAGVFSCGATSSEFKMFWTPASAGVTDSGTFARGSSVIDKKTEDMVINLLWSLLTDHRITSFVAVPCFSPFTYDWSLTTGHL